MRSRKSQGRSLPALHSWRSQGASTDQASSAGRILDCTRGVSQPPSGGTSRTLECLRSQDHKITTGLRQNHSSLPLPAHPGTRTAVSVWKDGRKDLPHPTGRSRVSYYAVARLRSCSWIVSASRRTDIGISPSLASCVRGGCSRSACSVRSPASTPSAPAMSSRAGSGASVSRA